MDDEMECRHGRTLVMGCGECLGPDDWHVVDAWWMLSDEMEAALKQWAVDREIIEEDKARPMGLAKVEALKRSRLYAGMSEATFLEQLAQEARLPELPGTGAYLGAEMAMNRLRRAHGLTELPLTAGTGRVIEDYREFVSLGATQRVDGK